MSTQHVIASSSTMPSQQISGSGSNVVGVHYRVGKKVGLLPRFTRNANKHFACMLPTYKDRRGFFWCYLRGCARLGDVFMLKCLADGVQMNRDEPPQFAGCRDQIRTRHPLLARSPP